MSLGYEQRLGLLAILVACGALVLCGQLFNLQVLTAEEHRTQAQRLQTERVVVPGHRGAVLDARGRVVAEDAPAFDLALRPAEWNARQFECAACGRRVVRHQKELSRCPWGDCRIRNRMVRVDDRNLRPLSKLLGISPRALAARCEEEVKRAQGNADRLLNVVSRDRRRRLAPEVEADHLRRLRPLRRDIPYEAAREVALHPERHVGLVVQVSASRRVTGGEAFVHVVGRIARRDAARPDDAVQATRLERAFDAVLRGEPGWIVRTHHRGPNGLPEIVDERPPRRGKNLRLTLDRQDQQRGLDALGNGSGGFIVLDADTGAVLVLATSPSYAPDDYRKIVAQSRRHDRWTSPLNDRVVKLAYAPGSVMKPITALAVLRDGLDPADDIECDGHLYLGGRRLKSLRCDDQHGRVAMGRALYASCNVYFQTALTRIPFPRFVEMGRRFGLGQPTGLCLDTGKSRGAFPPYGAASTGSRGTWQRYARIPSAIGQGRVEATVAQVARAYAALATGFLPRLRLVARVGDDEVRPARTRLDVDPKHLARIRAALARTAVDGTAKGYGLRRWRVSCKTGTAELGNDRNHAWLAGWAPPQAGRPRIAFAMVLLNTTGHGGDTCGPRLRDFLTAFYGDRPQ